MKKLITAVVTILLWVVVTVLPAFPGAFYWKDTKAELDAISGLATGDRGIVMTSAGVLSFYYYDTSAWSQVPTLDMGYSATPQVVFLDSGAPGSDKEIGKIYYNYIDGSDGAENADFFIQAMQGGSEVTVLQFDESDDQLEIAKKTTIAGGVVKTITANTTTLSLTSADMGKIYPNSGDLDGSTINLPEASTVLGQSLTFVALSTQDFNINPYDATDQIRGLTNAAGDAIRATGTIGYSITLTAVGNDAWAVTAYYGTWTDVN
jgi:hypothetical protein